MLYLAWRNVWRNSSRTWGLVVAVALSVAGLWTLGALVRGLNEQRLAERLDTSLGHIKVTARNFSQHKPVEAYFTLTDTLKKVLATRSCVLAYTPRLNVRASVRGRQGWGSVDVYGVTPEKERQVSRLYQYIKQGKYLSPMSENTYSEVLVGKELAKKMGKKLSDTLVLYLPAPVVLTIVGVYEVSSKDFSDSHIFLHEAILRKALHLPAASFHQILFRNKEAHTAKQEARILSLALPTHSVRSWQETAPDLAYLHTVTSYFLGFLVFLATIVLGILQYILWQSNWQERIIEWQRLRAWGLTKANLVRLWALEVLSIIFLGILGGLLIGILGLACLLYIGIDLAYFAEGLAKAGYAQTVYPVVWIEDIARIVIFLGILPLLGVAEIARKIQGLKG